MSVGPPPGTRKLLPHRTPSFRPRFVRSTPAPLFPLLYLSRRWGREGESKSPPCRRQGCEGREGTLSTGDLRVKEGRSLSRRWGRGGRPTTTQSSAAKERIHVTPVVNLDSLCHSSPLRLHPLTGGGRDRPS